MPDRLDKKELSQGMSRCLYVLARLAEGGAGQLPAPLAPSDAFLPRPGALQLPREGGHGSSQESVRSVINRLRGFISVRGNFAIGSSQAGTVPSAR